MKKIGLVGLAVMGQNLVLNMEENGFGVVVYNRTESVTKKFAEGPAEGKNIEAAYSYEEMVEKLEPPRSIMVMVKAGKPVDYVINDLVPHLDKGDTIIDGGNSHFKDTERREKELEDKGIHYLGIGVSGGEEGARHGPSMMPGGKKEAYDNVKDIFEAVAAEAYGEPCVTYLGPGGAGHFVKMVHNGIEYAIMQAISETYHFMKEAMGLSYERMHEVFNGWSQTEHLGGFLTEITADILGTVDDKTKEPLVEQILDTASQKGTGRWTAETALDLGVPTPAIGQAVFERVLSAFKDMRREAESVLNYSGEIEFEEHEMLGFLDQALYSAMMTAYAQGLHLIAEAGYEIHLSDTAKIWRGGCIIRSNMLNQIMTSIEENPWHLFLSEHFSHEMNKATKGLRVIIAAGAEAGVSLPVLSNTLAYYDTMRKGTYPPASMIQAQRDYFGSHTYKRQDRHGIFHTDWIGDKKEKKIE